MMGVPAGNIQSMANQSLQHWIKFVLNLFIVYLCCKQVVIKEKVLELLLYFTNHEDEEVRCKAIIGLGKTDMSHNTSCCSWKHHMKRDVCGVMCCRVSVHHAPESDVCTGGEVSV